MVRADFDKIIKDALRRQAIETPKSAGQRDSRSHQENATKNLCSGCSGGCSGCSWMLLESPEHPPLLEAAELGSVFLMLRAPLTDASCEYNTPQNNRGIMSDRWAPPSAFFWLTPLRDSGESLKRTKSCYYHPKSISSASRTLLRIKDSFTRTVCFSAEPIKFVN
jgi:hypothetical protein